MKATGIVRRIDHMGRVVLPIELRRCMSIGDRDPVEIFVDDGNRIVLCKYQPACVFCGNCQEVGMFKSLRVCGDCRSELGVPAVPASALFSGLQQGPLPPDRSPQRDRPPGDPQTGTHRYVAATP